MRDERSLRRRGSHIVIAGRHDVWHMTVQHAERRAGVFPLLRRGLIAARGRDLRILIDDVALLQHGLDFPLGSMVANPLGHLREDRPIGRVLDVVLRIGHDHHRPCRVERGQERGAGNVGSGQFDRQGGTNCDCRDFPPASHFRHKYFTKSVHFVHPIFAVVAYLRPR